MHIPNTMLTGSVCPVTAVISATGVALAAFFGARSNEKPSAARFAAITALIFAGQMMNFPVRNGTSGHLIGGVLAAALLGVPFGMLAMALVVTVQCLVFSDGGFSVLGANILNMALIAPCAAYLAGASSSKARVFLAAWLSVMAAALATSVELAVSGTIPFFRVAPAMLGTHALIGIGEGLITASACLAFEVKAANTSSRWSIAAPLAASGVIAALLSPFASGFPDGLEWVAEKYHFFHDQAPAFAVPLSDYEVPFISNGTVSTALAGLAGVLITFFAALVMAKALNSAFGVRSPHSTFLR